MATFQKNSNTLRDVVSSGRLATAKRYRAESTSVSEIGDLKIPVSKTQMERVHRYLKDAMEQEHEADIEYGGGDYEKAPSTNSSRLPATPLAQKSSLSRMIDQHFKVSERGFTISSTILRCKMALERRNRS